MEIGFIAYDGSVSSHARRAEPAAAAFRFGGLPDLDHPHLRHRCDHHLGDAHAAFDEEFLFAEIDQQDLHLAAIVAVDRAGRVEAGDAVLQREAGAGADWAS